MLRGGWKTHKEPERRWEKVLTTVRKYFFFCHLCRRSSVCHYDYLLKYDTDIYVILYCNASMLAMFVLLFDYSQKFISNKDADSH